MLAIRLMQLFSQNKADFSRLAGILGLYFQIRDDYINLCSKEVSFTLGAGIVEQLSCFLVC